MAQFVLGAQEAATLDTEAEAGQREEAVKRHYKKDSRFEDIACIILTFKLKYLIHNYPQGIWRTSTH